MSQDEIVCNHVGDLRKEKEVTQEELANSVSVSRQTVIAIEKGNSVPSVLLALKISDYFRQPLEKVFYIKLLSEINNEKN